MGGRREGEVEIGRREGRRGDRELEEEEREEENKLALWCKEATANRL